jgi:hypothetical protein
MRATSLTRQQKPCSGRLSRPKLEHGKISMSTSRQGVVLDFASARPCARSAVNSINTQSEMCSRTPGNGDGDNAVYPSSRRNLDSNSVNVCFLGGGRTRTRTSTVLTIFDLRASLESVYKHVPSQICTHQDGGYRTGLRSANIFKQGSRLLAPGSRVSQGICLNMMQSSASDHDKPSQRVSCFQLARGDKSRPRQEWFNERGEGLEPCFIIFHQHAHSSQIPFRPKHGCCDFIPSRLSTRKVCPGLEMPFRDGNRSGTKALGQSLLASSALVFLSSPGIVGPLIPVPPFDKSFCG